MARRFIDGFESGTTDACDQIVGALPVGGSYAATGSYGLFLDAISTHWRNVNIPASATYYYSMRIKTTNIGGLSICQFFEGAIQHIGFLVTANKIQVKRGTTTLTDSGVNILSNNIWYLVSGWVYIHDSAGRVVVDVNGINWIDFTGDTQNAGSGPIDIFRIGSDAANGGVPRWYYDDIVLDNANPIVNSRIAGIAVDGAGNSTQWTPSAGSNYQCVDEVPPSDADYVYVNSNDQVDLYSLANLGVSGVVIKSVQVLARAQKEGASTPQKIALTVRTGATDYVSSDQNLATAFKGHRNVWEQNPNTVAAWTESDVNGLEAGVKSRA